MRQILMWNYNINSFQNDLLQTLIANWTKHDQFTLILPPKSYGYSPYVEIHFKELYTTLWSGVYDCFIKYRTEHILLDKLAHCSNISDEQNTSLSIRCDHDNNVRYTYVYHQKLNISWTAADTLCSNDNASLLSLSSHHDLAILRRFQEHVFKNEELYYRLLFMKPPWKVKYISNIYEMGTLN